MQSAQSKDAITNVCGGVVDARVVVNPVRQGGEPSQAECQLRPVAPLFLKLQIKTRHYALIDLLVAVI